jgi:ethanolamine permease
MMSFIRLRIKFPSIHWPYRSPLGIMGAMFAMVMAVATLFTLFLNRDYKPGVIGAAIWFLLGMGYFTLYGCKRLLLAPEERFAEEARPVEWVRTTTP